MPDFAALIASGADDARFAALRTNAYSYDSTGNRTQRTITVPFSGTETYSVASTSNRLSSISNAVSRSFSYAASGQVSTDQRNATDTWTYTVDHAGRMADAKLNSTTQASFAYDGFERRIVKTNAITSAVTHYVYDSNHQLIAEMDGSSGSAIREYIWLGSLPIGYVDYLGTSGASRLFFIHADHLARPQKITDSTKAIVWDGVFAPFGEIHSITGSIVNTLMFPGQVYDSETGLSQNWHRDYDANIGRYLESDPIGLAGGINNYGYVGGNPLTRIDVEGLRVPTAPPPVRGPSAPPVGFPDPNTPGGAEPIFGAGPRAPYHPKTQLQERACRPFDDCEKEWDENVSWCEKAHPVSSDFRLMHLNRACHQWAKDEFERCKRGDPAEPFRPMPWK